MSGSFNLKSTTTGSALREHGRLLRETPSLLPLCPTFGSSRLFFDLLMEFVEFKTAKAT